MHQNPQVRGPSLVPYRPLSTRELAELLPTFLEKATAATAAAVRQNSPAPEMVTVEAFRAHIQALLRV